MVFLTNEAADGWEKLGRQAPGPTHACWVRLRTDPLRQDRRQQQLKRELAYRQVGDKKLPQWQYEVTGAGRVWYCPDPAQKIVWMTDASVGHPKATE